jgi:protoporphyrinogen oxidase
VSAEPGGTVVLGAGLAGLSAGYALSGAGRSVRVLEAADAVGGLARTVVRGEYRFDLGGHRFLSANRQVDGWVRELLGADLLTVPRSSRILSRGCSFEYPLRPLNALRGLGMAGTLRALAGYAAARAPGRADDAAIVSLQDWVIAHYGRPLYERFFRDYSEKVWGIPCERIAKEWIAQRIQGLSLGSAMRQALLGRSRARPPTLADTFLYPTLGIGAIAQRLEARIRQNGAEVVTGARVVAIRHAGARLTGLTVQRAGLLTQIRADAFISTVALPQLVQLLHPAPPAEVLESASHLRYRDLVIVAIMVDRPRVTGLTWLYLPDKDIPFGRVHEPTNWSARMAPPGRTLLVAEHFCFRGDAIWSSSDEALAATSVSHLERLGLLSRREVVDNAVLRIPAAYPLFELGYRERCETLVDYLRGFENLHIAGRTGMFRYYNMDAAIESGLAAAKAALARMSCLPEDQPPERLRRRA